MSSSLIASSNAIFRYYEGLHHEHPILVDEYSVKLASSFKRVKSVVAASNKLPFVKNILAPLQTVHCIRHASVDGLFLRELARTQARQVIILGAGLDSRRLRFRERLHDVAWIEVDRDGQQDGKEHFFKEHYPDIDIRFLSRDLNHDMGPQFWGEAKLDPAVPTIIIAEGLIHYLNPETWEALLGSFHFFKNEQSFIFSFITPAMVTTARTSIKILFQYLQEIPSLFFSISEMNLALRDNEFKVVEILELADQIDQFAPQARHRDMNVSQNVGLASK
mgnify:CR=1 FL=1